MKPKTFGEAMLSIILVIILIPLMIIDFNKEQETETAAVVCEFCDGACTVSHKTTCKTAHNAPNYYYYTYKCTECGKEFTVEKTEKNFKNF